MSARFLRRVLPTVRDQAPNSAFVSAERRVHILFRPRDPPDSRATFCTKALHRNIETRLARSYAVPIARASSFWSISISLVLLCGGLALSSSAAKFWLFETSEVIKPPEDLVKHRLRHPESLDTMPETTQAGHIGNLTAEQTTKLQEFWIALFRLIGEVDLPEEKESNAERKSDEVVTSDSTKPKRKLGLFNKKDAASSDATETKTPDVEDKFGQTKDFHEALATYSPEELRLAFWNMLKKDHPDVLLLRFLRARKWDVNRALIMFISALHWRAQTINLEEKIMQPGDIGALEDIKSTDPTIKKESEDFLSLLRLGESFIHGADIAGRPVCYIRVKLHRIGAFCEAALEKYTVYLIETSRLLLESPTETAALVFDLTDFSLVNMDYAPIKFMIKCFEANYPESLGIILVHKAPWLFSGIWAVIKGWLDPVVAAKVHFTKTAEDLEAYIPRDQLIKEIGGDNQYEYKYIEPKEGENSKLGNMEEMDKLNAKRLEYTSEFQLATKLWVAAHSASDTAKAAQLMKRRNELAGRLYDNYWQLDPYMRARSLYDRLGLIPSSHARKNIPSRTTSIRTTLSEKCSMEVATRPILVDGDIN
ncbi:phosphatidylinositol transfer protein csr1 [Ophidiomyces ophidiicola]|nr:phosphatidylinositol transfer protein csr1 [Ophidiomyces ophidiicola]KAI1984838.1 phosphatidylinositol transfer protein csr1 [Ophidiomyces ophidiicola]KAI1996608.1 phosphatidylinositol transfer protein csr1 [Ophidiomyces ophidiicola]KAI1996843.1 phosphatidylinositol transfer protein csr1 [Ophidiomyces ophidiicola]